MSDDPIGRVDTLAFDIFGTCLDLTAGLVPPLERFLARRKTATDADGLWALWRSRQRIEQFQDSLLALGHSGYIETARRALVWVLRARQIEFNQLDIRDLMGAFERLEPFEDVRLALARLARKYRLVALSNGNQWLLDDLCDNLPVAFEARLSVDRYGRFKPHPAVYRGAAATLGLEPCQMLMVAAHSFDVLGARSCGYRGAYIDRYGLPFEDVALLPDLVVSDFGELCDRLEV